VARQPSEWADATRFGGSDLLERRFPGGVVPPWLNLKDGYDGGLVVRDRDFGSGQWAR